MVDEIVQDAPAPVAAVRVGRERDYPVFFLFRAGRSTPIRTRFPFVDGFSGPYPEHIARMGASVTGARLYPDPKAPGYVPVTMRGILAALGLGQATASAAIADAQRARLAAEDGYGSDEVEDPTLDARVPALDLVDLGGVDTGDGFPYLPMRSDETGPAGLETGPLTDAHGPLAGDPAGSISGEATFPEGIRFGGNTVEGPSPGGILVGDPAPAGPGGSDEPKDGEGEGAQEADPAPASDATPADAPQDPPPVSDADRLLAFEAATPRVSEGDGIAAMKWNDLQRAVKAVEGWEGMCTDLGPTLSRPRAEAILRAARPTGPA